MDVRDYNPAAVSASNGNIGVIWVRSRMGLNPDDFQTYLKSNRNVFIAILSSDGNNFILPPTNLTNETGWYYSWDDDVPKFEGAKIQSDGNFHLT
jgi:hypothetical protein